MESKEKFLACDGCASERTLRSRSTVKLRDVKVIFPSPQRIFNQSLTDAVGAERLEECRRRKGAMAPGPGVVMVQSSSSRAAAGSGEVRISRTRRKAEDAALPSLQDLAESRFAQSAHGELMRLGELSCETSQVAEVFCPRRLSASCRFFDMLPDLRTGWNLGRNQMVVIGSLPQLSESAVKRLKPGDLQRLETGGLAHLTFCVSVYRWQSEKKRGSLHEHLWHVSSWSSEPMKALYSWADTAVTRCDMCIFRNVTWHRTRNRCEKRPSRRQTGWVTKIPELAETLSTTCKSEHVHASETAGRGLTTKRHPPGLAAILKSIRCYMKRSEGISIDDALETETDVNAKRET